MARGRMINNTIGKDKKVNELKSDTCRLLFTWLVTTADREGRTYGDPALVRSMVFPRRDDITTDQVEEYLKELHNSRLVLRYKTNGDIYIWFPNFDKNQVGLRKDREPKSELPEPPDVGGWMVSGEFPDNIRTGDGLIEVKRIEVKKATADPTPSDAFYCTPLVSQDIFIEVTQMTTFPASHRQDAIDAIRAIAADKKDQQEVSDYLAPFYAEWKARNYHKTNLAWLTDWAVTKEIPPKKANGEKPRTKILKGPDFDTNPNDFKVVQL